MAHQNFQDVLEQLSTNDSFRGTFMTNLDEIKERFELNEEDMIAMQSYNPQTQAMKPRVTATCCCCCTQSDN